MLKRKEGEEGRKKEAKERGKEGRRDGGNERLGSEGGKKTW